MSANERELISVYLDLASAKARQIAVDFKAGRTYASDVSSACSEIEETLNKVRNLNRSFEAGDK